MGIDYQALKTELLAGHPDTGAYNVDDQLAADELNAVNRPVAAPAAEILKFCLTTQHRENTGSDTSNTNIYGRIAMVAEATEGSNPFGVSPADSITVGQIAAAKTILRLLQDDCFALDLAGADINAALTKCQGANCFSPSDKTALEALSENKQSRAQEIGFGRPSVNAGHVIAARAM